jgi:hypothetical protein
MACYIDHNATGDKHTDCARKCIASGLPVGLKADDGKTYLIIGEHKPLNSELAQYAAQEDHRRRKGYFSRWSEHDRERGHSEMRLC